MSLEVSRDTLAAIKTAMKASLAKGLDSAELAKSGINLASGLTWYDLRSPALLQMPVLTPLRDKLPRKQRANPGSAANWKVIPNSGVTPSGYPSIGFVPEGQRSGFMSVTATPESATYTTIGEEGEVTWEAKRAAQGLDDANAMARFLTLKKVMLKEEPALLYGNKSNKLGTPTLTTSAPTNASATITPTTYYVAVVALTGEGMQNSSVTGGVGTQKTITGADGKTYTVNAGSSQKSAISTQVVSSGDALQGVVTPIKGALGYAFYVGTSNSAAALHLQAITTTNTFLLLTTPTSSGQTADQITADLSVNDGTTGGGNNQVTGFDGIFTTSVLSGSGAYFLDLQGSALTSGGDGSIEEFDDMLLTLWSQYLIGMTDFWMSARTARAVRKLILNSSSAPLVRIERSLDDTGSVAGGAYASTYMNPISVFGGDKIPLRVHPNLPDGVVVCYSNVLPAWYENNETPVTAEVLTRQDYYSVDWPIKTRADEFGVYTDEVLAVYAPWATAVICGIAV